jgi:hypothetical protein
MQLDASIVTAMRPESYSRIQNSEFRTQNSGVKEA